MGEIDAAAARELGRTMARLHVHAEDWSLPDGGTLPRFETPLFGDEDLLEAAPDLTAEARAVIGRARDVTTLSFALVHAGASLRPIHADLHGDNVKWDGRRLAVFDFDDAGLGLPVVDLAVTTFYLRGEDPEPERALRAGYAEVLPVPEIEPELFEALVAARQLLLANSRLSISTAELRRDAANYLGVTVDRLRWWLRTGTFTRAPPGR